MTPPNAGSKSGSTEAAAERAAADVTGGLSGRRLWLLLAALTLLAGLPRLVNLDRLSFYGDEETSAYPARAMAEGRGAVMPSGMEYRRGLLVTWMSAATARLVGLDREVGYRLPSAILGMLTVPLLFLFGRRYLGTGAALVAAVALALSEWHLVYSRMARMYVPFVFFFLGTGYAAWRWSETGRSRYLFLTTVAFVAAALTHAMATFAVMFAAIPIGLSKRTKTAAAKLVAWAATAGLASYVYFWRVVQAPFDRWPAVPPVREPMETATTRGWPAEALASPLGPEWTFGVLGGALGVWAGLRVVRLNSAPTISLREAGMVAVAVLGCTLLAVGQLWGAGAWALVLLVVHSSRRLEILQNAWIPALLATTLGLGCVVTNIASQGMAAGLKQSLIFPFPYLLYLFRVSPTLVLLFGGLCLWAAVRRYRPGEFGPRAVLLATLLPILAVGSLRGWGHLRFLLPAYPFLLLAAIYALVQGVGWVTERVGWLPRWTAVALPLVLVLAGLLQGHGIASAWNVVTLEHGEPVGQAIHQEAFRPDHASAGEFVRRIREPGDVVVAEDPLQQAWYAGGVDYWFRSYRDARQFLYVAPDGSYRDMYVESRLLPDATTLDSIARAAEGRVWIITSGETIDERDHYLALDQRRWLDSLERARTPTYVARDSATKVFCLNCPEGTDPAGD